MAGRIRHRLRRHDRSGGCAVSGAVGIVVIGRNDAALALPLEAVRDVETPEPWVLLARDGEAVKAPVKVGLRGVGRIEITEGLTEGEVAILPAGGALDGDAVRVKQRKASR